MTKEKRHVCYGCGKKLIESKMFKSRYRGFWSTKYSWFCNIHFAAGSWTPYELKNKINANK